VLVGGLQRFCRFLWETAQIVHDCGMQNLDVMLSDGTSAVIEIPDDVSLDNELQDFLNQTGRFMGQWISVRSGVTSKHVRYDQITQIETRL
jgi:hypothetical protein